MKIILLESEDHLEDFFAKRQPIGDKAYLPVCEISPELIKMLHQQGFELCPTPVFSEARRDELVKAYVELIGEVNRRLAGRLWWATDFSSKNRFNTDLPQLLQKYLAITRVSGRQGVLLIVGVPWQIRKLLRNFFAVNKIHAEEHFFAWRPAFERTRRWFCIWAANIFHFFRTLYRQIYCRSQLKKKFSENFFSAHTGTVIKTFVYDHSFKKDGQYQDAFFGKLPEFLEGKGEKIIVLADLLGDFRGCIKKIKDCPKTSIIPLEYFLSWQGLLLNFAQIIFYGIIPPRLKKEIFFERHEIRELVNEEITQSGRIQFYQYLHYEETKTLAKKFQIKNFLLTYENNPWEKMCILALREKSPQTEIIGYQHTVTPQASVNMFLAKAEETVIPKPDRVLTVGEIPKRIIERYTQVHSMPIQAACALRYENLFQLKPLPRTRSRKILLALEGIFDVYKMVNYVIGQIKSDPKYQIIIRTHPVLPIKSFRHKLLERVEDLPFVEISKGHSLDQDIERTDMTVYWGSTVALESLWVGNPVIHFDMETLFSYDPLFDCPFLKWTVTQRQSLIKIFAEIYGLSDESFLANGEKAREYLQKYFYPVNPQNLAKFLPR